MDSLQLVEIPFDIQFPGVTYVTSAEAEQRGGTGVHALEAEILLLCPRRCLVCPWPVRSGFRMVPETPVPFPAKFLLAASSPSCI